MIGVRVAISAAASFPMTCRVPVERVRVKSAADRALMGCDRFDECEDITFNGAHEFATFHLGRAVLRVLREFKLTGEGASPIRMNCRGIELLRDYRSSQGENHRGLPVRTP